MRYGCISDFQLDPRGTNQACICGLGRHFRGHDDVSPLPLFASAPEIHRSAIEFGAPQMLASRVFRRTTRETENSVRNQWSATAKRVSVSYSTALHAFLSHR